VRRRSIAALSVLALVCVACTPYRLVGSSRQGLATIAIVALENDSVEPGVELVVTRALRQGFLRRGTARLVSEPDRADFVIRGSVLPLKTVSTSYSTVALAIEYTVRMELEIELETADGAVIRIGRDSLAESELYLASADVEAARKNRNEALQRIADVLAARVHDSLDLYFEDRDEVSSEGPS
jgi:hypothetical protein